jgi:hypothetical protein
LKNVQKKTNKEILAGLEERRLQGKRLKKSPARETVISGNREKGLK